MYPRTQTSFDWLDSVPAVRPMGSRGGLACVDAGKRICQQPVVGNVRLE